MKKHAAISFLLLFGLMLFLPAAELLAQSGGMTGAFSRIGFGPRGIAMGNALTSVTDEGAYSYYNPALAAVPGQSVQLDFASAALSFDRQLHMAGTNFQMPPSAGISISLINARTGKIDGRTSSGYHTDMLSTSDYQLLSNFGIRLTDTFWAGIGIKFNLASYHEELSSSTGVGFDIGFRKAIGERLAIAFAAQDLFATNRFDTASLYGTTTSTETRQDFPRRFTIGSSYWITNDLLIAVDYQVQAQSSEVLRTRTDVVDGRPVSRTVREDVSTNTQLLRSGVSYAVHERITTRAGVRFLDLNHEMVVRPSAGFSLHLPFDRFTPSVDYAFAREPGGITNMHLFSIKLHL